MIRRGDDLPRFNREWIVVFAPAHGGSTESGSEVDALHRRNRKQETRERRFDRVEERLTDAGGKAGHDPLDDAPDAVSILRASSISVIMPSAASRSAHRTGVRS